MSMRFFTVCLCAWAVGCMARGDEGKTYVGTFKDAAGHTGPLTCVLTPKSEGKWTASLSGKNTGVGPNRPYKYSGEFVGTSNGTNTALKGSIDVQRQGVPFLIKAVLTDAALQATFQKEDGTDGGSFDLTLSKENAPTAPADTKTGTPGPTSKTPDQKPK